MIKDALYLVHIFQCLLSIEQFTAAGHEAYAGSPLIRAGVQRKLEIMGEAAKRISPELKSDHPEVAWRAISGTRDKLIHHYLEVDDVKIWEVVEHELPALKDQLSALLAIMGIDSSSLTADR